MIRRPWIVLFGWCSATPVGKMPPPAPYSWTHYGVWRPYFGELLTEWLTRIGMPKARYGRQAPPGAVRLGILKEQRKLVRCEDRHPNDFLAVYLVLDEDVAAVIAATEYDPRQRTEPMLGHLFSRNGKGSVWA